MLEASDQKVLLSMLSEMGTIINAVPKEVYVNKDAETLLIMQRRLPESELKRLLVQYNEIFARQTGAGIPDITNSMIAYVKIKILLEAGTDSFDGHAYRELYKECKNQIARTNNIIRLTKASAVTAEEYQKDRIESTLKKNSAFIASLESEIAAVEKKLERLPKEEEVKEAVAEEVRPVKDANKPVKKDGWMESLRKIFTARKEKKELDERLKNEEKKQSKTFCEEIVYYDKSLVFTECKICKDIPAYSLMKRKNNVYFGMSKNVGKTAYNNSDGSLVELTRATEEFLQFMTEDLLCGEYALGIFSEEEKAGMQMYFDFMTRCFEQHIGVTLTVREYLNYKIYYNRLVSMMFELERREKEDYYKALILADRYLGYMKSYTLECAMSRDDIIKDLVNDDCSAYVGDLDLILDNHIVEQGAKEDLENLKHDMEYFHKEEKEETIPAVVESAEDVQVLHPEMIQTVMPRVYPSGVTQNIMQIVIQILDAKKEVIDEAIYAGDNIGQALYDYERKDACIKRLGFRNNGVDVFYKEEAKR